MAVGVEREAGKAAKGSDVLILFADWFTQQVDFNVASLLGEAAGERCDCYAAYARRVRVPW